MLTVVTPLVIWSWAHKAPRALPPPATCFTSITVFVLSEVTQRTQEARGLSADPAVAPQAATVLRTRLGSAVLTLGEGPVWKWTWCGRRHSHVYLTGIANTTTMCEAGLLGRGTDHGVIGQLLQEGQSGPPACAGQGPGNCLGWQPRNTSLPKSPSLLVVSLLSAVHTAGRLFLPAASGLIGTVPVTASTCGFCLAVSGTMSSWSQTVCRGHG